VNVASAEPGLTACLRERALAWEAEHGLPGSVEGDEFRTFPAPEDTPTEEGCRFVAANEGTWPGRLPADETGRIETFAEAFTRAISKETTLGPEKLSLGQYKRKISRRDDADTLNGTPWEDAWREADDRE